MDKPFRLVRHFTLASVGLFAAVAIALGYFERQQGAFFEQVQNQELAFVSQVQERFAKQQEEAARADLLAAHEHGNVDLTRLFANSLWARDFAPFVARVATIPVDTCRALGGVEKKACFEHVRARIEALPGFLELDAKVFDTMRHTSVFKIKVFDARGITAYSSDHSQIGEDKAGNVGWQGASKGTARSELTHRDKFSAFEGVVENRDLISSYLPVLAPGGSQEIVGVFEVYSDVTPLLARVKATSAAIAGAARANEATMQEVSSRNIDMVDSMSARGMAIVGVLMAVLFFALFALVRRAESILIAQDKQRELDYQQLTQSEKMASLGQMAAGVAHQLNTPLAFSRSNINMAIDGLKSFHLPLRVANALAQAVNKSEGDAITVNVRELRAQLQVMTDVSGEVDVLSEMLGDTLQGIDQMHGLVQNLQNFTRLDRAKIAQFDLNKGLRTVTYIARSAIPRRVEVVEEYGDLQLVECNPSQLNQVFLNLINNAAQAIPGNGKVTVRSKMEGKRVRVDVTDTGTGIPEHAQSRMFESYFTTKPRGEGTGLGLPIVKSIVEQHGGEVRFRTRLGEGTTFSVYLPLTLPEAA